MQRWLFNSSHLTWTWKVMRLMTLMTSLQSQASYVTYLTHTQVSCDLWLSNSLVTMGEKGQTQIIRSLLHPGGSATHMAHLPVGKYDAFFYTVASAICFIV
jgi:hypothetical protein